MNKTKSFSLVSGYEDQGRYQLLVTVNRKGTFLTRGRFNLFTPERMKGLIRKHNTKRLRELGYTLVLTLNEGEVAHHITNEYMLGIPEKVHQSMATNDRDKHRAMVLNWLKENDKVKYEIAKYLIEEVV